jgi:hypothetical protein
VTTSRECDVSCEVIDDQAQFVLGDGDTSLHLVLDRRALARLAEVVVRTQKQWQDVPSGEFADFTVTASKSPTRG